ncbi:ATPase family AAA domain-containing protein 2-like [Ischnura elegans]|uniref:ATPase family AAA domain-containing protein 2-like n=1 Tax=Ischnura elegans TaxID=197161 RepID=UPI001ED8B7E2|nr:ATPase family AAA domain-containing protein 2-like [Ischnura elegans]
MDESIGFCNVGGLQEHIRCLKEIVLFPLIYKDLYEKFKIRPPKGVLFYGPPGTGKTLVAGALADECNRVHRRVSFFSLKGAECLTKWVGESEKHLRTLFEKAGQLNPSIIFFDEIDGLAPIRSSHHDQVHASVVSTLLALMDGLNTKGQIVVIGATNRIDAIDPALRRPGRFDRELYFPLPSFKARYEIIMVHAGRLSEQVDTSFMRHLANTTEGYCGSDIQALCSEALMCSVRRQFPEMYSAERPLDLSISELRVERRDFQKAKSKIIPAALRVSYTPRRRLPSKIRPLFGHTLYEAMDALRKTSQLSFIQDKKQQRQKMPDGSIPNVLKGFGKNFGSKQPGIICPHFLLVGSPKQGHTDHLAPAMLHCLEDLPVTTLDIMSLFETSARTPEEALIHKMKEARQSLPGVIYLPDICGWWNLVDEAARTVFLTIVRELDAENLPILLLATAHEKYGLLPGEIQKLFCDFHGQVFTVNNPSEKERREFFSRLLIRKASKPPSASDMSCNGQKQVLLCKVCVTLASSPPEEPEKKKSKSRKRKIKEVNPSPQGQPPEKCKGAVPSQQLNFYESPAGTSSMSTEKPGGCTISLAGMRNDELKQSTSSKNSASNSEKSSTGHRRKSHSSRSQKRQSKSTDIKSQLNPFENMSIEDDIQPYNYKSKGDDFHHDTCDGEDTLSSSSSLTSIGDEDMASEKQSAGSNDSKSNPVRIDRDRLEKLVNQAVNITEGCTLHAILILHSKLLHSISKYKDTLDRMNLPQELEENLEKFEESDDYHGQE